MGGERVGGVTHLSTSGQSPAFQYNLLGSSSLFSGPSFAEKAENTAVHWGVLRDGSARACSHQVTCGSGAPSCPFLLALPVEAVAGPQAEPPGVYAVRRPRAAPTAPGALLGVFTPTVMGGLHTRDQESQ